MILQMWNVYNMGNNTIYLLDKQYVEPHSSRGSITIAASYNEQTLISKSLRLINKHTAEGTGEGISYTVSCTNII